MSIVFEQDYLVRFLGVRCIFAGSFELNDRA